MKMNTIYFNIEPDRPGKKKSKVAIWLYIIFAAFIILLNILAWLSVSFCDWHTKYIFPIWINTYGRLTSLIKPSIGEVLLITGIVILAGWLISGIVALVKKRITTELKIYSKVTAWIILAVCFIMTQNCFILYHNTTFVSKYLNSANEEYSLEELTILRDYIVENCNELALKMERDENLDLIYNENLETVATNQMKKLGEEYPWLSGFYVRPKTLHFSKFFSQQSIMGYYFPFSLEANYNKLMYIANFPTTICHELAHSKGYMKEYDCNFIGFFACINSEDTFLKYCGYLSVLNYVNNDYIQAINRDGQIYNSHVKINDLVKHDNIFLTDENWKKVEESAVIDTKTVKQVANNLMDASLKMNGVKDGRISYNQVVGLLLKYYDGKLY